MARRVGVFFYGLFMDQDLLRAQGVEPENPELASVGGMAIRIGRRATLVPDEAGRAYGVVMMLKPAELNRLYADSSLRDYRAQNVTVDLASGGRVSALCYNLPVPPQPAERNPEYTRKLKAVAEKVGLPAEYIASLP